MFICIRYRHICSKQHTVGNQNITITIIPSCCSFSKIMQVISLKRSTQHNYALFKATFLKIGMHSFFWKILLANYKYMYKMSVSQLDILCRNLKKKNWLTKLLHFFCRVFEILQKIPVLSLLYVSKFIVVVCIFGIHNNVFLSKQEKFNLKK